jgi:hypothetical protein
MTLHMMVFCSYSKSVRRGLQYWIGTPLHPPPTTNYRKFKAWWSSMLTRSSEEGHLYGLEYLEGEMLWVFDNTAMAENQLRSAIQNDVQQWQLAWRVAESDPAL